jgi:hypothetical protein
MSSELPWDRFAEEEPELPYKPPDTSWRAQPDTTWPTEPGPPVPEPEPEPILEPEPRPVEDAAKKVVRADAKNRSGRTLIQGLLFDLLLAFGAAVAALSGLDPFKKETWIAFGVLVGKSFVSAGIAYFMRMRGAPTVRTKGEQMAVMPMMVPKPER